MTAQAVSLKSRAQDAPSKRYVTEQNLTDVVLERWQAIRILACGRSCNR